MSGAKTVYETKYFDLYTDKNGKFWLWDKVEEINLAIREKTEVDAYKKAIDSLCYWSQRASTQRKEAESKLEKLEETFKEVFRDEDSEE